MRKSTKYLCLLMTVCVSILVICSTTWIHISTKMTLCYKDFNQSLVLSNSDSRNVLYAGSGQQRANLGPIPENNVDDAKVKVTQNCIEKNICKDSALGSDIYYYNRTNFDMLVEMPVNFNATINNSHPVVPRKVHFCLFSNEKKTFRFHYMLAIMAASRFVKPDVIYFWHDILPIGKYWEETRRRVKNLFLVQRDRPKKIRGNDVKVLEHVADVVRLEALLEYGGMYFDTDSIVVNPIDPLLVYDVTMGHAVKSVLANGIMFSVQWSDFFRIWHKEYRTFNDKKWGDHSVIKPFQLSRRYPNLVHIEAKSLCRPHWQELGHLFGNKPWNWKKNNYVVHLYMRFGPKIERNPENIKTWNTTAGSIMRYIYYGNDTLGSHA